MLASDGHISALCNHTLMKGMAGAAWRYVTHHGDFLRF